ncbi:hypothetical protein LZL87_013810 [Fusarium oxysporum]|nr:hypothetical protein LZL87_013810 [Fusarium oxysporum]
MANPNLSGGLIGIPTEIIINVVNALINDANSKIDRLEPTLGGLSKLQHANFSRIAEYVRSLTFLSPPSWELPFAAFQGIIQDTMPDDQTGFEDPQQAGAYATYIYHARESQVILTDPDSELRRLWVKTLKLFGGSLHKICLLNPREDDDRLCLHGGLDYLCKVDQGIPYHLGPHRHLDHGVAYGCRYPAAIAGDQLFAMVISCLAASGVAMAQITVKNMITGTFDCAELQGWDLLDFSALQKIEFSPETPEGEHHSDYEDVPCLTREEIEQQSARILNAMAHKSLATLKTLILNGRGIMDWAAEPATLEFPVLEQFVHAFGWVNPIVLSTWLRSMPKLRYLELNGLDRSLGVPYIEWRHLFDAIRDHPSVAGQSTTGLEVDLCHIHTSQWVRMSCRGVISHDSDIASERKMLNTDPEGLMDSQYCLEKHFYNESYHSSTIMGCDLC